MKKHIIMIEDEKYIAENYRDALNNKGFKVSIYHDKESAMAALAGQLPDLVLVDIGLGEDTDAGFDICNQLRARSSTLPIVFLTARDGDFDKANGFFADANDYLTKSIPIDLVIIRIQALFRRVEAFKAANQSQGEVPIGNLTVNADCLQVKWKDQLINLSVTEFWIVKSLTDRPGNVKSKDALRSAAQLVCEDNTITTHIKRIRKKFMAVEPDFNQIDTVMSAGYRWLTDV